MLHSSARAAAACGALVACVAFSRTAAAGDFVPSLSLQGGVTATRTPGANTDDFFVAATPQLIYFFEGERTLYTIGYSFTGSLNTELPNGIANRLAFAAATDLTPRTRLVLGADALQSLIGNYLLVKRAAATQLGNVPSLNTSLLTVGVTQGISYEITPVVRFSQGVTGTYVTSLDPDVDLKNYLATGTLNLDRSWEFDAVGAELGIQYSRTNFPPVPEFQAFTIALGPTWDHDLTTNLSTSLGASAQVVFSPDRGTAPARIGPAGRASIFYSSDASGIGLDAVAGIEPNLLVGTLLQSQQVVLRGYTPISERNRIIFGVSGGYLHAKSLDLSSRGIFANEFEAVLHDADITWAATDYLSIFLRYQFIGQGQGSGPGATPPIVRHGAIIGVDLFASRPAERARLPKTGAPRRVDRGDAQQLGRSPSGSGSSGSGSSGSSGSGGSGGSRR